MAVFYKTSTTPTTPQMGRVEQQQAIAPDHSTMMRGAASSEDRPGTSASDDRGLEASSGAVVGGGVGGDVSDEASMPSNHDISTTISEDAPLLDYEDNAPAIQQRQLNGSESGHDQATPNDSELLLDDHSPANNLGANAGGSPRSVTSQARAPTHAQLPQGSSAPTVPPAVAFERDAIVKSLFGANVGSCVAEFAVSYNRVMGRLFVASRAVMYHCNIFGFERRLCLQFRDITHIEAYRSTSIRIFMVDCEEYVFKKFSDHENVAKYFQRVLVAYRAKHPSAEELSLASNSAYSESMVYPGASATTTTAPTTTGAPVTPGSRRFPDTALSSQSHHHHQNHQPESRSRSHLLSDMSLESDPTELQRPQRRRCQSVPIIIQSTSQPLPPSAGDGSMQSKSKNEEVLGNTEITPNAANTSLASNTPNFQSSPPTSSHVREEKRDAAHDANDAVMQSKLAKFKNPLDEVIINSLHLPKCSLQRFYDLFLSDDAIYPVKKYQTNTIGDRNIQVSAWSASNERHIKFDHPLQNAIGPSHATTRRKQTLHRFDPKAIVMESETHVHGIPAADCFRVRDRWFISATTTSDVTITISFQIEFTKFSMLKPVIQHNCKQETKKWFQGYLKMVREAIEHENKLSASSATKAREASSEIVGTHDEVMEAPLRRESDGSMTTSRAVPKPAYLTFEVVDFAKICMVLIIVMLVIQMLQFQQTIWLMQQQMAILVVQNERFLILLETKS